MTRLTRFALMLAAGSLIVTPMTGCAFFTAQRVGTFAAKETGKAVYRSYREHQHERESAENSSDGGDHSYQTVNDRSEE